MGVRDQSVFSAVVVGCLTGTMITSRWNKWRTGLEERCGLTVWSSLWEHWLFYFHSACWQSCAIDSFLQQRTEATDSTHTLKHNHNTFQQWKGTHRCDSYGFSLLALCLFYINILTGGLIICCQTVNSQTVLTGAITFVLHTSFYK